MRIISKFHDYYDGVQGMAHDSHPVYLREQEEIITDERDCALPAKDWLGGIGRFWWPEVNGFHFHRIVIGFCGKLYPMIRIDAYSPGYGRELGNAICYSPEEISAFVDKHARKREVAYYHGRKRYSLYSPEKQIERWFADMALSSENSGTVKIFRENLSPIFTIEMICRGQVKVVWNAQLKPLGFVKVFPPYQAWQEIEMFVGGLAMPGKEMPKVPDVINAESHGFNKYSFRRDKSSG